MKIGINLVGVSYNNAKEGGRLRDYENSIQNFYTNVVNPLRKNGHEVQFYLFSYKNEKLLFEYNNDNFALKLKKELQDIQYGRSEDPFGWRYKF